eukprot:3925140-Pyramimonas_sp.AAC.1
MLRVFNALGDDAQRRRNIGPRHPPPPRLLRSGMTRSVGGITLAIALPRRPASSNSSMRSPPQPLWLETLT